MSSCRATNAKAPVENAWNVYVWPTESGEGAYCVGHDTDRAAALHLATRFGAEQIQYGLDGEVVSAR